MTLVLIVEDNPINRDVLGRRLERRGFNIRFAEDGPSGIAAAKELMPDVILMDIGLGEMDGWEATRRIKADPVTAAIPIIALTASAFESDRDEELRRRLLRLRHQAGRPAAAAGQDREEPRRGLRAAFSSSLETITPDEPCRPSGFCCVSLGEGRQLCATRTARGRFDPAPWLPGLKQHSRIARIQRPLPVRTGGAFDVLSVWSGGGADVAGHQHCAQLLEVQRLLLHVGHVQTHSLGRGLRLAQHRLVLAADDQDPAGDIPPRPAGRTGPTASMFGMLMSTAMMSGFRAP